METTMIENTSPETETNVPVTSVSETPEPAVTEVQTEEVVEQPTEVETPPEEPTVELDGEQVPLSQVKKWKEDYANDSKWKDKNRREGESINQQKERYRRLELLEPLIEQHPEVLQSLFTPTKPRDFDAELKAHYQKQLPTNPETGRLDDNAVAQWNYEKDILLSNRAEALAYNRAKEQTQQSEAKSHNERIETEAYDKYVKSGKITDDEFKDAARFIVENVAIKNGKVPSNAFDVAYKIQFEERWLSEMKIDQTKKATEQIFKAQKGASEPGKKLPTTPPKTPQDKDDDEFVKRGKARVGKDWIKLP